MSKEDLEKKVAELELEVEELNAKLSEYENTPSKKAAKPILTIGKDKYQVQYPKLKIGNLEITVADLKANELEIDGKKICNHLLAINSGMLLKIEKS